jgi:hypothetical protein
VNKRSACTCVCVCVCVTDPGGCRVGWGGVLARGVGNRYTSRQRLPPSHGSKKIHIELTPNPSPPRPPGGRRAPRRRERPRRGPRCRWSRCRRRAGTGGGGADMVGICNSCVSDSRCLGGVALVWDQRWKGTAFAGHLSGGDRSGWAGKRREEAGTLWRRGTV